MLPAAALDILEGSDLQRVAAHLPTCKECTRLLDQYRDVSATLPLLLPDRPVDPDRSAALRTRLLARARGEHQGTPQPEQGLGPQLGARTNPRTNRWTAWTGWLVAAGLAGLLLAHHSVHRPVNYGWLTAGVLTFLVIGLGIYVRVQRARTAALRDRLAALERERMP